MNYALVIVVVALILASIALLFYWIATAPEDPEDAAMRELHEEFGS